MNDKDILNKMYDDMEKEFQNTNDITKQDYENPDTHRIHNIIGAFVKEWLDKNKIFATDDDEFNYAIALHNIKFNGGDK